MTEKRSRRRGRGSPQPYMTKAGERWKFQIYVPRSLDDPSLGQVRYTRGGFTSMAEADIALNKTLAQRDQNLLTRNSSVPLGKYATQWLDTLRLAPTTIRGYRNIINNHLIPYIGEVAVDKLTATRIARLYRDLERNGRKDATGKGKPLGANSVNKVHIVLGSILEAALDDGLIMVNPSKKRRTVNAPTGKQIRAEKTEVPTWNGAQLQTFLAWNRDVLEDELHPLWRVIAYTGMRRGEALALKWDDLNTRTSRISLRRAADAAERHVTKSTKTGSARVLDIDAGTLQILKAHKALRGSLSLDLARPEAYMFGNNEGELRSPNEISRRWSYRVAKFIETHPDAPRITLKDLRHTHATVLLELSEHPKVVQERLGHSTISTTMNIYSHVTPTMQRTAIDRLAQHIENS